MPVLLPFLHPGTTRFFLLEATGRKYTKGGEHNKNVTKGPFHVKCYHISKSPCYVLVLCKEGEKEKHTCVYSHWTTTVCMFIYVRKSIC